GYRFGKMKYVARTVLIVEDSDTSADTLEIALLSLPDVTIAHAATGRKAWQLIQNEGLAAIITDLHMPHMDGFELIERVRSAGGSRCADCASRCAPAQRPFRRRNPSSRRGWKSKRAEPPSRRRQKWRPHSAFPSG